jgi:hypothetical protein
MSKKQTMAIAHVITLLVVLFVCNQPDFEIHKHWLVVIILAPVTFISTYGVIVMTRD